MLEKPKYTENDNINYELREKYSKMSIEEIDALIAELERKEDELLRQSKDETDYEK